MTTNNNETPLTVAERVKDFTYYPLMSDTDCAFACRNTKNSRVFSQCTYAAKETIEGYGFCLRHAAVVRPYQNKEQ